MHQPTGSTPNPDSESGAHPGRGSRPASVEPSRPAVRPKGRVLGSTPMAKPPTTPTALHFTPDAEANRLARVGAARGDARDAARPAGPDGVGLHRARVVEGAARRCAARRDRDREDGSGRARSGVPRQARAAPLPGLDGEADPRPLPRTSSTTTTAAPKASGTASRPATSCSPGSSRCPASACPKARIFVGLLGKRLGVRPPGWEAAAADWPSIADVDSFERVLEIREKKRAMKAAAKAASAAAPS